MKNFTDEEDARSVERKQPKESLKTANEKLGELSPSTAFPTELTVLVENLNKADMDIANAEIIEVR